MEILYDAGASIKRKREENVFRETNGRIGFLKEKRIYIQPKLHISHSTALSMKWLITIQNTHKLCNVKITAKKYYEMTCPIVPASLCRNQPYMRFQTAHCCQANKQHYRTSIYLNFSCLGFNSSKMHVFLIINFITRAVFCMFLLMFD